MRVLWPLLLALLLSACTSPVAVDYDEKVDFGRLHTFSVLPPPPPRTDDPRLDNPILIARIQAVLREALLARGYREVQKDPDFRVSFQLGLRQGVESNGGVSIGFGTVGSQVGIGMVYGYPGNDVSSYEEGMLTIDVFSPDKTLIWRGTASQRLSESGSRSPEESRREIRRIVDTILQRFPPNR